MKANRIIFILFFVLFIAVFPLATVYFSKSGLDLHKTIKSDMAFHLDSIRIDLNQRISNRGPLENNQFFQRTVLYLHGNDSLQNQQMYRCLFEDVIPLLSDEDRSKMDVLIPDDDSAFYSQHVYNWRELIDTAQFYFMGQPINMDIVSTETNSTIVLLDGRVSRKEKGADYLNGPILCDTFNLAGKTSYDRFMKALVMVLPKGNRKRLEFKSDEKLF